MVRAWQSNNNEKRWTGCVWYPLTLRLGLHFEAEMGGGVYWHFLLQIQTQANLKWHMIITGQEFKWAKCEPKVSFASTALPRCLRLAFFEHYQDKVLTDVKNSAFNQLNHFLMDSCMCSVTSMYLFKDMLHSSSH